MANHALTVPLFHRHYGARDNPPLVILHGLLGSSRNWQTVAKSLAEQFSVFALDLRNHGESPHADAMDYPALAEDVRAWLDAQGLEKAHLLGHSMGGKTAMLAAVRWPERLASLTVVDIAPRSYESHHRVEFAAMNGFDIGAVASRQEAEEALAAQGVHDWAMRQFLLTNVRRDDTGGAVRYAWSINLPVLSRAVSELCVNPLAPDAHYAGPVLFVRGGKSNFMRDDDTADIQRHFPRAAVLVLPNAGHNPHIDARELFATVVQGFLARRAAE